MVEVTSSTRSDETLLADLRAGHDRAFAELYARHHRAAVGVARRVVGRSHAVDDVVAESFTSLLAVVRDGGGPSGNVRSYLLTTVRNTAIRYLQAQERAVPAEPDVVDRPHHDADKLVAADDAHRIRRAFAALPPRWRRVLWYVDVHELPPAQAGPLLGVSPNATSSLARRARERLRREYLQAHQDRVAPGCEDYAPHLARYVEGSLAVPVHHRVEVHVLACAPCTAVVEQMRDLRRRMRAMLLPLGLALAAGGREGAEAVIAGTTPDGGRPDGGRPGAGPVGEGLAGVRALGRRWWWARPRDVRRVAAHGATVAVVCLVTLQAVAASDIAPDRRVDGVADAAGFPPGSSLDGAWGPMPPPKAEPRPDPTPEPPSTPDPAPEPELEPPAEPAPELAAMPVPAPTTPTPVPPPWSPAPSPGSGPGASSSSDPASPPPSTSDPTPPPPTDPAPSPTPDPAEPPLLEIVVGGEPVVRVP